VTKAVILEVKSAMLTIVDKLANMVRSADGSDEIVKCIMGMLLNLVKLLLYCHKYITVSHEHLDLCMCIASLPWIANSKNATMIPSGNEWTFTKWKQLARGIAKHVDPGPCLEVVTMFPSEYLKKWKVHVFIETLVRTR
jgi:hypothetical protein